MNSVKKLKISIQDMAYIALFSVIIAICSWISIPGPVPFTLQTFAVFLAVGLLGGRRGTLAVLIYLLLGAVGVPVFAGFSGGLGYLMGSTGGYIIGFLASALIVWAMEKIPGNKKLILPVSMVAGLIVCYLFGTIWFVIVYARQAEAIGFFAALSACVIPFIIPDLLKIGLAILICSKLTKILKLK